MFEVIFRLQIDYRVVDNSIILFSIRLKDIRFVAWSFEIEVPFYVQDGLNNEKGQVTGEI